MLVFQPSETLDQMPISVYRKKHYKLLRPFPTPRQNLTDAHGSAEQTPHFHLGHLQRCGWTQRLSYRVKLSQKEKTKYRTLMHTGGIQKNGTDDPIGNAEIEKGMQKTNEWIQRGMPGRNWEREINIYTLLILCIKYITKENRVWSTGNST